MKRLTMIVAMVLAVAMPMMAERVTPETARKVAATFLNNNGVKTAQLTDLSKAAGFPNLYIFNAEPGFVVMAADDCVQPILGYSFENTFVAKDMPENVRGWLQGYSDEIQYAIESKMKATAETAQQWNDLLSGNAKAGKATAVVGPLIQTKWSQGSPYNMYCPGGSVTGCVATAMAQVMKYWNYPSHGIGSHSYSWNEQILSANFADTTYDWANMKDTYNSYNEAEEQAVATLMYHCGVSVEMNYGTSESGATTRDVVAALTTYFNYSTDARYITRAEINNDTKWIDTIKVELNADPPRPLQYRGKGHSFICDGYDENNYLHINWGWGGGSDGYYSIENMGNHTADQAAIFGIHPSDCTADVPNNLTYTQNGRSVTFKWDAATGAANYNIYRDYNYIGNSTTNSYIETAPYGTHIYIVRSVDSNGELSLSSNTVTILVEVVNDLKVTLSGDNTTLSWTAPKWCYPETSAGILTYGDGTFEDNIGSQGAANIYWGHRYLAENLTAFSDMVICKLSFYSNSPGNYEYFIYKGTNIQEPSLYPNSKLAHGSFVVSTNGWIEIELDERLEIDNNQDLWVFVYDPEAKDYPAAFCNFTDNTEGCYYSSSDPLSTLLSKYNGVSWLIRTYLTDGTYTYNLYQDGTKIAENLSETSYSGATLNDNAANLFTVKTNYYGGESAASNMAGFAKGTASLASLEMAANDKMTVTENSKLTVTGTLSNSVAANLVIENGAQLIHNSTGVKATVKKSIAPYTTEYHGWNFIASPVAESVTPSEDNGLIANVYDLYYYDEQGHHWRNYRKNSFDLAFKQGYLYANDTQTTLEFAGTLTPSNASVSSNTLSYNSNIDFLKGFNLVGNPFACNATLGTTDCYVIDSEAHKVTLAGQNRQIAPCEGVFVKVSEASQTVSFSKAGASKGETISAALDLVVAQGRSTLDRARVRLGEGTPMEKFTLDGDNSTQLTLWQDGQEYAVVYANDKDELPLNFKAAQNGTYTLGIETNSLELEYLHLIDNMTGDNIDLLVTPSYTFDAKTTDYVSRFKLIFKEENKALTGSTTFAYINDGNIIITGANDNVTIQIVDVMGHIIASCGQTRCIPTTGIPAGVYVLRLIDGENVKVQKIVIE